MNISGISGSQGGWPVSRSGGLSNSVQNKPETGIPIPQDQLEISSVAKLLMELSALESNSNSAERTELINRIREEIAQGTYDTDEKLELAFQKFFDRHGSSADD